MKEATLIDKGFKINFLYFQRPPNLLYTLGYTHINHPPLLHLLS